MMSPWQRQEERERKKAMLLQQREDLADEVDARSCICALASWRMCEKRPRTLGIMAAQIATFLRFCFACGMHGATRRAAGRRECKKGGT